MSGPRLAGLAALESPEEEVPLKEEVAAEEPVVKPIARLAGLQQLEDVAPVEEPAPEARKPLSGASRGFDLTFEGQLNRLKGKRTLDPMPLSYENPRLAKEEQMRQQGPGIYAAPEPTALDKVKEALGGRLLSQPVDVVKEILLSPDRGETIKEVGKDVLDLATFGTSDFIEKALDAKSEQSEVMTSGVLAGLGLGLTKPGRAAMKYAFKGVKGGLDLAVKPISYLDEKLAPVTDYVWDNVLVKGANARVIPTFEKLPGSSGSFERINKSLAEIVQPAVERLNPKMQSTFRTTQAMKAHVSRIGSDIAEALRNERPTVRYEVIKGLRGTDPATLSPEANRILTLFDDRIRDVKLKTSYEVEFKDRLSKLLTKNVSSASSVFTGQAPYQFLQTIEQNISGKVNIRKVQKALVSAIEDPNVAPEWKSLALEIHNLPASLPEDVAKASKEASTSYLASKLKGWKGVVRAAPPAGQESEYLKSKWAPFNRGGQPLYVKRDVELELRALQDIPKMANGIFNKFFMSPWKVSKVMLRPAAHIRNTISNAMLNHVGGLPFWHVDTYIDALKGMKKGSAEWKDFSRITGAGGSFSVNEVNQLHEGLKYGSTLPDHILSIFDRQTAGIKTLYNAEEQWFKFAKYLHNLDKGMGRSEAAWDAQKWTFNYGEITRATARMRTYAAPFITWQTKIIPLMAEAAVKNPVAFATMMTMYQQLQNNAISSVGMTQDEFREVEQTFPEYIKDGMFLMMPWRDDRGQLNMLNMTYMIPGFGDITDIKARPMQWFLSNPVLTIASAIQTKTRFSGAPIYYDWEDPGVKMAKMGGYVWEQLMPAVIPGGTDWNMMYDTFTDVPEGLSGPQAVSSALGFKITPVDEAVAARKSQALQQIHLSEMGTLMKQELRRARNDDEKQAIIEKYARLRPELLSQED